MGSVGSVGAWAAWERGQRGERGHCGQRGQCGSVGSAGSVGSVGSVGSEGVWAVWEAWEAWEAWEGLREAWGAWGMVGCVKIRVVLSINLGSTRAWAGDGECNPRVRKVLMRSTGTPGASFFHQTAVICKAKPNKVNHSKASCDTVSRLRIFKQAQPESLDVPQHSWSFQGRICDEVLPVTCYLLTSC